MTAVPAAEPKLLTEAEYEALGNRFEIIDGQLRERMPMSSKSVVARDNLYDILKPFVKQHDLGYLFNDGMIFYMWKTTKGIKGAFVPDIAFVRKANLAQNWTLDKNYPGIPDLAIEVVSSRDEAEKVITKAYQYLDRGTEQVWVVYPEARVIHQYFRDRPDTVRVYQGEAKINADAFFPGVEIVVSRLFQLDGIQ